VDEFRDMVKALHRAGIEVILDVVFNHTAEGDHNGPTLCFRGLDNSAYYILDEARSRYANYTGTGNTLNANHPIVRRMIVDSLRYWVEAMHVDGFRFDLASILARDGAGQVMASPPVLWDIESEPALAGIKLMAEAWDAAGLYQVGSFVGDSWKEWNGRFRDDARSFFRGEKGFARRFADRLIGSPEIYAHEQREPEQSVNFVTCHDGFTLNDLVSYDRKHNEANGEDNHDGADDNRSWNCGIEGPTDDPVVERLRNRQVKNLLAVTLLSIGLPMILMGDEVRRSQRGNNNAYCQDNETSWTCWSLLMPEQRDFLQFTRRLVRFRRSQPTLTRRKYFQGRSIRGADVKDIYWLDPSGREMTDAAWNAPRVRALGVLMVGDAIDAIDERGRLVSGVTLLILINAHFESVPFVLPVAGNGHQWARVIDTIDAHPPEARFTGGTKYPLQGRTVVLFTLVKHRPHRRASDHEVVEIDERLALQVVR